MEQANPSSGGVAAHGVAAPFVSAIGVRVNTRRLFTRAGGKG